MVQVKTRTNEENLTNDLRRLYRTNRQNILSIVREDRLVISQNIPSRSELEDLFSRLLITVRTPISREIFKAYEKGVKFANNELKKRKVNVQPLFIPFIDRPNIEGLELRALENIRNLNANLARDIRRIVADGIQSGQSTDTISLRIKNLYETLPKSEKESFMRLGRFMKVKDRVERIARTVIIDAHTEASIRTYKLTTVVEGIEWLTARDERVCPICAPLNGKKFKFDNEIMRPPIHPQCRCAVLPVLFSDNNKDWSKAEVVEL